MCVCVCVTDSLSDSSNVMGHLIPLDHVNHPHPFIHTQTTIITNKPSTHTQYTCTCMYMYIIMDN